MWKNMFFLSLSWSQWSRTQTLVTKTQYCNASPCITGQSHIFQCDTACCPPASAVAAKSEDILSFHTSQQVQTILSKWMWLMSGCFKPFQSWWIEDHPLVGLRPCTRAWSKWVTGFWECGAPVTSQLNRCVMLFFPNTGAGLLCFSIAWLGYVSTVYQSHKLVGATHSWWLIDSQIISVNMRFKTNNRNTVDETNIAPVDR